MVIDSAISAPYFVMETTKADVLFKNMKQSKQSMAIVLDEYALETLLGRRLRVSPSQLEKYYTCRYGYFLQYVLGLKPRRRAELSATRAAP